MNYLYTCILNGFDNQRPLIAPKEDGWRYVCFTNVPNLPRVEPWEYRPIYDLGDPSRTSRVPKILPHVCLPDAEYSIYHDGNLQLQTSPQKIIDTLLAVNHWSAFKHPARTCIYEEADVLLNHDSMQEWLARKPERARLIQEEICRYRRIPFPEKSGLWANGFIARRHNPNTRKLNEIWWQLFSEGSERDQLSFPVARRKADLHIETIDGEIHRSGLLKFNYHAEWKHTEDNPNFWPQRKEIKHRLAELARLTRSDGGIHFGQSTSSTGELIEF